MFSGTPFTILDPLYLCQKKRLLVATRKPFFKCALETLQPVKKYFIVQIIIYLLYTRYYNPRFVYFFIPFLKSISLFSRRFFLENFVSILLFKSPLWYVKKYDFQLQLEKVFYSEDITGSEQINDSCRFEPQLLRMSFMLHNQGRHINYERLKSYYPHYYDQF